MQKKKLIIYSIIILSIIISCLTVSTATNVDSNNSKKVNINSNEDTRSNMKYDKEYYDSLKESWDTNFIKERAEQKNKYNQSSRNCDDNTLSINNTSDMEKNNELSDIPFFIKKGENISSNISNDNYLLLITDLENNKLNFSIPNKNNLVSFNSTNFDCRDYIISIIDENDNSIINSKLIKITNESSELTLTEFQETVNLTNNYIKSNKTVPDCIEIGNRVVSSYDLLYLLCDFKVNNNNSYFLGNFSGSKSSSSYTNCYGKEFSDEELILIAKNILTFYEENNQAPSSITTIDGIIVFEDILTLFIEDNLSNNNKLTLNNLNLRGYTQVYNFEDLRLELENNYNNDSQMTIQIMFSSDYITDSIFVNSTFSNIIIMGNGNILYANNEIPSFLVIPNGTSLRINDLSIIGDMVNTDSFNIINDGTLILNTCTFRYMVFSVIGFIRNNGVLNLSGNSFEWIFSIFGSICDNEGLVFSFSNEYVSNGATIGGVFFNKARLISSCDLVWGCHAYKGAYIFNNDSICTVSQLESSNNSAHEGIIFNLNSKLNSTQSRYYNNNVEYGVITGLNSNHTINNCSMFGNLANNGGIYLENSNAFLNNNLFYSNHAIDGGVGYFSNSSVKVNNSHFYSNSANTSGVFSIENNSILKIYFSDFNNNSAENYGGVITNINSIVFTSDNIIYNSTLTGLNNYGGLILNYNSSYISNNDTIKYSKARDGAVIHSNNNSVMYIFNSTISNNTAICGSIFLSNSTLFTNNTQIYNNNASFGASLYAVDESFIVLNNSLCRNELSSMLGGSIYMEKSILNMHSSRIIWSTSHTGGAIYSFESQIFIKNSEFERNVAKFGAAIAQLSEKLLFINKTRFNDNYADNHGGAVYVSNSPTSIEYSNFTHNIAYNSGGVIYSIISNAVNLDNCVFTNNHARYHSALVKSEYTALTFNDNAYSNDKEENLFTCENIEPDLNYNWWGTNEPNFNVFINGTKPSYWMEFDVFKINNSFKLEFNKLNNGSEYDKFNILRTAIVTTNDTTNNITLKKEHIYVAPINIATNFTLDNQTISFSQKKSMYFYFDEINLCSGESGTFKIYTNKDAIASFLVRVNGHTVRDSQGNVIYNSIENGVCEYTFDASTLTAKQYNLSYLYTGDDNYNFGYFNFNLTIKPITTKEHRNITTLVTTRNKTILDVDDQIAQIGNSITIKTNTNIKTNGTIVIKLLNEEYESQLINGESNFIYNISEDWHNNSYISNRGYVTVHVIFRGNDQYLKNDIKINLYLQQNNSTFNLNDYGFLTSVKEQEVAPSCWAFATLGALESAMIKQYEINNTIDFSENYLKNIANKYSKLGFDVEPRTGNTILRPINYLLSWNGLTNETNDPYNWGSVVSEEFKNEYNIQEVYIIPNRQNEQDNTEIKRAILKYGAVISQVYFDEHLNDIYYNNQTRETNWYSSNNSPNHAIIIVGWDDNYDKNNFKNENNMTPPGNGAFIIKNSFGEYFGSNGFNYVSYYDNSIGGINGETVSNFAFILDSKKNYTKIYQNEIQSTKIITSNATQITIGNTYQSTRNEAIMAIGTYFLNPTNYTITVYKNQIKQYEQEGEILSELGYRTIELNAIIYLEENDNFTASITFKSTGDKKIAVQDNLMLTYNPLYKNSFINLNGTSNISLDHTMSVACLKVYTTESDPQIKTVITLNKRFKTYVYNVTSVKGNISYYLNGNYIKTVKTSNVSGKYFDYSEYNVTNNTFFTVNIVTPYENLTQTIVLNYTVENKNILPDKIRQTFQNEYNDRISEYIITIPCYYNVTLPNVISTDNETMNYYILNTGENGTLRIHTQRFLNLTINGVTINFSNVEDYRAEHTIKETTVFVRLNDSTVHPASRYNRFSIPGLLIFYEEENIIIKYFQPITGAVNQYSVSTQQTEKFYSNDKLPRLENTMYCQEMTFNFNTQNQFTLTFTEGIRYDERGFKYQLYYQNITDSYENINYSQINYPINYTKTQKPVIFNDEKIIQNEVMDDFKTVFTYQDNQETRIETLNYTNPYHNLLQTYSIVSQKINKTTYDIWENNTYSSVEIKNTFLIGLKTILMSDLIATIASNMTQVTWTRINSTMMVVGYNYANNYINLLNPNMAMIPEGNISNIIMFRLMTSIAISEIEYKLFTSNNYTVSSLLENICKDLENGNYATLVYEDSIYIITGNGTNILKINTTNGLLSDYKLDDENVYHGLNFEDKTRTSLFNLTVGSSEADDERLAGNIIMTAGSLLFVVPGLQPVGLGLMIGGAIISADANGVLTDVWNTTRWVGTSIDVITSAVPYGKIFGILKGVSKIGPIFARFADKLDSIGGLLFNHEDILSGVIKAGYTTVAEIFFMDGSKSIPESIVDGFINLVPTKLFTKLFADFPFAIGKWLVPLSKEADDYQTTILKAIYDYDTMEKVLMGTMSKNMIKSIFTIKTIIGVTHHEILFYYGIFCNFTTSLLINFTNMIWQEVLSLNSPTDFDQEYVATQRNNDYYNNHNIF